MKKRKNVIRVISTVLASALLIGAFSACAPAQAPADGGAAAGTQAGAAQQARPGDIERGLIIALNAEPPSIAPGRHTALISGWMNELTHNGLFRITPEVEMVPSLVASWTAISDTVFEFTLHEGIMFHNGEEMTADDVIASWYYVRNYPEGTAVHASVVSAEAVGRYTVRFDTGVPNAMLFADLTHHANAIMPKSLIEAGHDFQTNPVGSGPYVFDHWQLGDSVTFTRFDDFFDTDRMPSVTYVQWRVIPEGASRTIALEMGEVDLLAHVAFPDLPRMRENPDITVLEIPSLRYRYMILNHDDPRFANVYVRRAIDMALDKEAMLIAGLDGMGIPLWVSFPPTFAGVSHEGIRSFDPEGARALLASQNIDPATLGFEIHVISEEWRREAEVAQANLADIGISTTISMIDTATWFDLTATPNWEATFSGFTVSTLLSFLRQTLHHDMIGAGSNRSRYNNPEFSALIEQAIATIDDDARIALLYELTKHVNENAIWIPNSLDLQVRVFNSRLRVPELTPLGALNVNTIYWAE